MIFRFVGDIGNNVLQSGDVGSFTHQNFMKFSTVDSDNDISPYHCAGNVDRLAGFWFAYCCRVCPVCEIQYFTWVNANGSATRLRTARMLIKPQ